MRLKINSPALICCSFVPPMVTARSSTPAILVQWTQYPWINVDFLNWLWTNSTMPVNNERTRMREGARQSVMCACNRVLCSARSPCILVGELDARARLGNDFFYIFTTFANHDAGSSCRNEDHNRVWFREWCFGTGQAGLSNDKQIIATMIKSSPNEPQDMFKDDQQNVPRKFRTDVQ